MTEKIESMEVHPMRGHSRGEWYCSVDDIAPSDGKAEYWAVFGKTHRGNRHCLGEFPTKSDAMAAARGFKTVRQRIQASRRRGPFKSFGTQAQPAPQPGKKIVQIEVVPDKTDSSMIEVFALCEDGTIWRRGVGVGRNDGLMDDRWECVPIDGIGDLPPA